MQFIEMHKLIYVTINKNIFFNVSCKTFFVFKKINKYFLKFIYSYILFMYLFKYNLYICKIIFIIQFLILDYFL